MKFLVEVTDDSMSNKLDKGDVAIVRSGFILEAGHLGVFLVTDEDAKISKLYIRNFRIEENKITLIPSNPAFSTMTFEGEDLNKVQALGIVFAVQKAVGGRIKSWLETAHIAKKNRQALETNRGRIIYGSD